MMSENHVPIVMETFGRWGFRRTSEVFSFFKALPVEALTARAESLLENKKVRMVKLTITAFKERGV